MLTSPPRLRRLVARLPVLVALPLAGLLVSCGGPTYVRGEQVPGLEDQAMGTGLDKRDIEQLLHENLKKLMDHRERPPSE